MHKLAFLFRISGRFLGSLCVSGQSKASARDLGVPFDRNPGPLNAIIDVKVVRGWEHYIDIRRRPAEGRGGTGARSYVGHKQRTIWRILR